MVHSRSRESPPTRPGLIRGRNNGGFHEQHRPRLPFRPSASTTRRSLARGIRPRRPYLPVSIGEMRMYPREDVEDRSASRRTEAPDDLQERHRTRDRPRRCLATIRARRSIRDPRPPSPRSSFKILKTTMEANPTFSTCVFLVRPDPSTRMTIDVLEATGSRATCRAIRRSRGPDARSSSCDEHSPREPFWSPSTPHRRLPSRSGSGSNPLSYYGDDKRHFLTFSPARTLPESGGNDDQRTKTSLPSPDAIIRFTQAHRHLDGQIAFRHAVLRHTQT